MPTLCPGCLPVLRNWRTALAPCVSWHGCRIGSHAMPSYPTSHNTMFYPCTWLSLEGIEGGKGWGAGRVVVAVWVRGTMTTTAQQRAILPGPRTLAWPAFHRRCFARWIAPWTWGPGSGPPH